MLNDMDKEDMLIANSKFGKDYRVNSGLVALFATGGGPSLSGYGNGAPRGGL